MAVRVWPAPRFTRHLLLFYHGPSSLPSKALRKYLDEEHRNKKGKPFYFTGWIDLIDEVRCALRKMDPDFIPLLPTLDNTTTRE